MVDYDAHSSVQQQLVHWQAGRTRDLVGRLGLVEPELRVVDYGCGPGRSAIDAVVPAIESYRARYPDAPIAVCHADQPGNDWNALLEIASGPSGYRTQFEGVRTETAIGSFYEQMVDDRSVALATCYAASQWLSRPIRIHSPGAIWFAELEGAAREEMMAVALQDWSQFLSCRAAELRPGGFLLVSTFGAVPDAAEPGGVAASGRGIYRAIRTVAESLAHEGSIRSSLLDDFLFGVWFLTEREARSPLLSPELADSFAVEQISVEPARRNAADVFQDRLGDPDAYARAYTGYTRAFADSTLRTHLLEPSVERNEEVDGLAAEFYERFEELYRRAPGEYACELWVLTVVLRRS